MLLDNELNEEKLVGKHKNQVIKADVYFRCKLKKNKRRANAFYI